MHRNYRIAFLLLLFLNTKLAWAGEVVPDNLERVDRSDTETVMEFIKTFHESEEMYKHVRSLNMAELGEDQYKKAYNDKIEERNLIFARRQEIINVPFQIGDISESVQVSDIHRFSYNEPIRTALMTILVNTSKQNNAFLKSYAITLTDLLNSYLFLIPEFSHLGIHEQPRWGANVYEKGIITKHDLNVIAEEIYRDILFVGILNSDDDKDGNIDIVIFDTLNGMIRKRQSFNIEYENPQDAIREILDAFVEEFGVSLKTDVFEKEMEKLKSISVEAFQYYGDARRLPHEFGKHFINKEYTKAALHALHKAHVIAPNWFLPDYLFSDLISSSSRDLAIDYLKKSLEKYKYSPEAWWALEMYYITDYGGASDEALEVALKSVEVGPWHGYSLLSLGSRYSYRHEYVKAYKYADKSLGLAVNMEMALGNFIKICFTMRKHKDLWELYNKTWATKYRDMLDRDAGFSIGKVLEEENIQIAIEYYKHLINKGYHVFFSLQRIGWLTSNHLNNPEEGLRFYEEAKGVAYHEENKKRIVDILNSISLLHVYRTGEYEKAIESIREARQIDESLISVNCAMVAIEKLSEWYLQNSEEHRLNELYDEFEGMFDDFHRFWDARGQFAIRSGGDKELALEYAKKGAQGEKGCMFNYNHLFNLGKVYYINEKYIDAIRTFNQCINIKSGLMRHYYLLALAEYKYGDHEDADVHFQKAAKMLKDYPYRKQIEDVLTGNASDVVDIINAQ